MAVMRQEDETEEDFQARRDAAAAAIARPEPDAISVNKGFEECIRMVCPHNALQMQKRYMRYDMPKPDDMLVRTYVNHVDRINKEELKMLPPFTRANEFGVDEFKMIVINGLPKKWYKQMDLQGFDPDTHSIMEIIEWCEHFEAFEKADAQLRKNATTKDELIQAMTSEITKAVREELRSGRASGEILEVEELDLENLQIQINDEADA